MRKFTGPNGERMVAMTLEEVPDISAERLAEIAAIPDEEIDTSDIPELDDEFWKKAVLIPPPGKERLTLRLDNYVIDYFKRRGRGYQSRINAVLRAYVHAQLREEAEAKARAAE
jgi:uncharacterized protein (DUF4415 family)